MLRILKPLRIALAAVGLTAAVYGAASLTGGWLGTPRWWEVPGEDHEAEFREWYDAMEESGPITRTPVSHRYVRTPRWKPVPRPERESISGSVAAAGLGLAAFALWPRKPVPAAPSAPTA